MHRADRRAEAPIHPPSLGRGRPALSRGPLSELRDLPAEAVERLEEICDRFEAAWAAGERPGLEAHLGAMDAEGRRTLFRELLVLEVSYRRRLGEFPTPDDYAPRFPDDLAAILDVLGEQPTVADGRASRPGGPGGLPEVDGFQLLGEVGRGGMGVVYRAVQLGLGRVVALKMVLTGVHTDAGARSRFRAEAESAARLRHPDLVQIHGAGESGGHPYLVMEYVEGGSLAGRLDGEPWPAVEAARFIEVVARAIDHAHRAGVIHRDLKPANILLSAEGRPRVSDFGLAKSLDDERGLTRTDLILGSPSYMAPEQAEGRAAVAGPAADVYAMGAIFYELLTGRPPFKEESVLRTLELVRTAEPRAPSKLVPRLDRDAEAICLACLRKEPSRRYPDALALAEDLRRFAAGEPIAARRAGRLERGVSWARRKPGTAALAGVSTLLFLALAALVGLLLAWPGTPGPRSPKSAAPSETRARSEAPLREPSGEPGRAAGAPAAPDVVGPITLAGHSAAVWDAAISPDGLTIASTGFDREVLLWDRDPRGFDELRRPRRLLGHDDRVYSVAFSPRGDRVVSASADRTAIVWDARRGEIRHRLRGHADNVRHAEFSPDGEVVATGSWDGTIRTWDARTGRPLATCATGLGRITRLAFRPDGGAIAAAGTSDAVELWDHRQVRRLKRFTGHEHDALSVSFSPDGRRLASTAGDPDGTEGVVRVWDVATGDEILAFGHPGGVLERVAFSPDGGSLATAGWDGVVRLWDSRTGRERLALPGHRDRVWGVNFGEDGRAIVSGGADGSVRLWRFPPVEPPRSPGPTPPPDGPDPPNPALSDEVAGSARPSTPAATLPGRPALELGPARGAGGRGPSRFHLAMGRLFRYIYESRRSFEETLRDETRMGYGRLRRLDAKGRRPPPPGRINSPRPANRG